MEQQLFHATVKSPSESDAETLQNMADFESLCGLPQCAGAIDGCFIPMEAPAGPFGCKYWCCKNIHAIILLAICDARGKFIYVNVGQPAIVGDAAAFSRTSIKTSLENGTAFSAAHARVFPGANGPVTVHPFLVGDSAFALTQYMMSNFNGNPPKYSNESAYDHCHIRTR